MLSMTVITLREGIEAFLIVAITLAYMRKTGRGALAPAVYWGTGTAAVLSLVLGVELAEYAVQSLWEGVLAGVAAVLVISMVVYMLSAAKHISKDIGAKVEAAAQKTGSQAWLAVFLFVVLMVTREGMEMAFITASLATQTGRGEMFAGARLGIAIAAALAWAWSRYGRRVNLGLFFQVTSIFLLLFALQLLIYSFHEFSEAGELPLLDNERWHAMTEPYGPDGEYGHWLSYSLVLIPAAWLIIAGLRQRKPRVAA